MTGVEGSIEPLPSADLINGGNFPTKQAHWNNHIQTFPHHHHQYHESVSTSASDSANSSPTTTASTVDDSSATEMSPGSSPESPMAKPYLSSFSVTLARPHTSDSDSRLQSSMPFSESQRPTTPHRRPRNLKNLAVNTSGTLGMGRAASTTSLPMSSAAKNPSDMDMVSLSLSKAPSPPKRRPTNLALTIQTPANINGLPQLANAAIPPTPSFTRPTMLRHFQSSPSLPLHSSSRMFELANSVSSNKGKASPQLSITPSLRTDDSEPNFDIPLSKEEKPEAYPDGPICVYGPRLDLYLEPTAKQALGYDVIMNVASEVRNPFNSTSGEIESGPDIRLDGGGGIQYAPRRNSSGAQRAASHRDVLTPVLESSPTTPKATPSRPTFGPSKGSYGNKNGQPEYIHIPWEHNTDIVPDLLRLVKVIDDRINDGKRVLIHCQCGVSRSATLVVAYVIYKNPSMSVQECYDAVKRKSKWIGPNMNLIMQLQEFRNASMRPTTRFATSRGLSPISPSLPQSEWGRPGPYADEGNDPASPPKTAPLPIHKRLSATIAANTDLETVGLGPSSAPSGVAWPSHDREPSAPKSALPKSQESAYVDPSGHVVPVVKIVQDSHSAALQVPKTAKERPRSLNLDNHTRHDSGRHFSPMLSPRSTEFAMGPLKPSKAVESADTYGLMSPTGSKFPRFPSASSLRSSEFAMSPLQPSKAVESADTFGLMSPTASEFSHSPLDRDILLGSLGMGSAVQHQSNRSQHLLPNIPQPSRDGGNTKSLPLRPKISAPSLRQQQELQAMQSRLEATLAQEANARNFEPSSVEALMSPRAFEFTQNPFALAAEDSMATAASVAGDEDPRSPAQKGVNPITRSIFDVL